MSGWWTSALSPPRGRRSDRPSWWTGALLALVAIAGCATYRPQPLDDQAVATALAPPDAASVRALASSIHHPILKPVALDLAAPLGPDQVALVAVVFNPGLKALRKGTPSPRRRSCRPASCPTPSLSLSLDHPVGGSDAGSVNALGAGLTWEVTALIGRDARIAAAEEAAEEVAIDVAWQEWQVAMAARLAATRLVALEAQVGQSERILAALRAANDRIAAATARGLLLDSDRIQAEAAVHDADGALSQLRHDRDRQRILLTQALGLPPGSPGSARWPGIRPGGRYATLGNSRPSGPATCAIGGWICWPWLRDTRAARNPCAPRSWRSSPASRSACSRAATTPMW